MFLGISPVITNWSAASDEFSLILDNNPMAEFAELPEGHEGLLFSNILCGVLRGALEMVRVLCHTVNCSQSPAHLQFCAQDDLGPFLESPVTYWAQFVYFFADYTVITAMVLGQYFHVHFSKLRMSFLARKVLIPFLQIAGYFSLILTLCVS